MTKHLYSSPSRSITRRIGGLTSALAFTVLGLGHAPALLAGTEESDAKKAVVEKKPDARVKFSWLIDVGDSGSTGGPDDNQLYGHVFTDRNGEPLLNQATFTVERALAPEAGKTDYGFKFQATAGSDARFLNPIGEFDRLSNDRNTIAVVEAYGSYHVPVLTEGGLDIRVGQFASPEGAEVIYPSGNFFYSHSYTFNFGIPLQHLGAMLTLHTTKELDLYAGVVRGANIGLDDNNDVVSFIGGFVLTLLKGNLIIAGNTSIGAENDAVFEGTLGYHGNTIHTNGDLRYYNEANITFKPTDKLSLITDLTFTRDDGFETQCYGVAQYATYAFNKYLTLGVRGEIFRDSNGFFVTQFGANDDFVDIERGSLTGLDPRTVGSGGDSTYAAVTVGGNVKVNEHILIRPELRYDKELGGRHAYTDSTQSHQFTGALDVLFTF